MVLETHPWFLYGSVVLFYCWLCTGCHCYSPQCVDFFSGFETLSMQLLGTFVLVAVLMAMQFHFLDKNLLFKAFTSWSLFSDFAFLCRKPIARLGGDCDFSVRLRQWDLCGGRWLSSALASFLPWLCRKLGVTPAPSAKNFRSEEVNMKPVKVFWSVA